MRLFALYYQGLALSYSLVVCDALVQPSWRPLPHVDRREILTGATVASSVVLGQQQALATTTTGSRRSVASVDSHVAIPVWPSWGGGRVVPVSLGGPLQDPFLLLAHHKHWFDPHDPLREPFKVRTENAVTNLIVGDVFSHID